jgi:DNA-binding ferritin-like protein
MLTDTAPTAGAMIRLLADTLALMHRVRVAAWSLCAEHEAKAVSELRRDLRQLNRDSIRLASRLVQLRAELPLRFQDLAGVSSLRDDEEPLSTTQLFQRVVEGHSQMLDDIATVRPIVGDQLDAPTIQLLAALENNHRLTSATLERLCLGHMDDVVSNRSPSGRS